MSSPSRRTVFFVSDRTGITAEMLGTSMLVQFDQFQFDRITLPFVDSGEKVEEVIRHINQVAERDQMRPIVFSSIVDEEAAEHLRDQAQALTLDVFQVFISPLEAELRVRSSHTAGRSHGIANSHDYFARMEAINFTQAHDDGAQTRDLGKAQIILVGVSRCGKTPTSLYLALQFGVRTANFPLTPDDFVERRLPASVLPHRDKLFGLTIQPERLREIREERRPNSRYASLDNCRFEVREAEHLIESERIPMIDTTTKSIEEIATTVLHRTGLRRTVF
ncbi:MAG TPA: pyruvate, water dikinase regulatory protein [Casimicrobiaceae bacterium]|nr:pyruvate, water dikinase regulatory protein [Casimicrobiaceae bacterium]